MNNKLDFLKKSLLLLMVGAGSLAGMTACGDDDDDVQPASRRQLPTFTFCLKNESGQDTTVFSVGENIFFTLSVKNNSAIAETFESYALFALVKRDETWYDSNAISTSGLADYAEQIGHPTAFAVYTADGQLVGYPMDKIGYEKTEVGVGETITYQCPWLSTGGQTVYSSIFRKEQLREPLPAGKYYTGVLCTHHYKYPRTFDLKINFTVQ